MMGDSRGFVWMRPGPVAWVITLVLGGVILWLTLGPAGGPGGGLRHPYDKVAHALGFAALVLPTAVLQPRALLVVLPLALGLGALIEVVQPYVGRGRELADLVADVLGALGGAGVGLWIHRHLPQRLRPPSGSA